MASDLLFQIRYRIQTAFESGWSQEPVFQSLVGEELARLKILNDFQPVGHAANYSLLYCLLRMFSLCDIRSALELGCGQSTRLLAALVKPSGAGLLSLEEDGGWAERVAAETGAAILHAPVVPTKVGGRTCRFYPLDRLPDGRRFDLVLVDGPIGTRRWSRLGAVTLIPRLDPEGWTVIFDDAQRPGEHDTIRAFRRELRAAGLDAAEVLVRARKWQHVFYSRSRPQVVALGDAVG